ncbi:hypothetical protein Bca52824_026189 [Brassica carinata]|uniref:Myb-like domain-containing protein n=1 Tax=Brassica carinata TaxID=52824 RepID=A0A8X7VA74_BRACI|nr:hypothetical protein Bca52824_026189 [Brassica carinata]
MVQRSSKKMWTHKDDAKLISGTMKYGRNWARVSASIFHHEKSPMACKERHLEITEPKVLSF